MFDDLNDFIRLCMWLALGFCIMAVLTAVGILVYLAVERPW